MKFSCAFLDLLTSVEVFAFVKTSIYTESVVHLSCKSIAEMILSSTYDGRCFCYYNVEHLNSYLFGDLSFYDCGQVPGNRLSPINQILY